MCRRLTIALLLACLCSGPSLAQVGPLETGDARFEAFDNEGALRAYEQADPDDSTDFEMLYRMARTWNDWGMDLSALNDEKAAEEAFNRAVYFADRLREHHPGRAETWFYLAACNGNLALFKGGREKVHIGQDVEAYGRRAIEIDPDYALAYIALGIFYREVAELNWVQRTLAKALFGGVPAGSYQQAEEQLHRAIELDPNSVIAHYELAITLERMDRRSEAAALLGRATVIRPVNTEERRRIKRATELLRDWNR